MDPSNHSSRVERTSSAPREHVALRLLPCLGASRAVVTESAVPFEVPVVDGLTSDEAHFADADDAPNSRHALLRVLHPTGYRDLRR